MSDRKSPGTFQRHNPRRVRQHAVEFTNYHKSASMYTYEAGMTKTLVTPGTYYVLDNNWSGNLQSGSTKCYYNTGNGRLYVGVVGNGKYDVFAHLSASASKVCQLHGSIHISGVHQQKAAFSRDIATANQIGDMSMSNEFILSAGDYVEIRLESSAANTVVTVYQAQFRIRWEGGGA